MLIRPATSDDDAALWAVLEPAIRGGESFALPRDMAREAALAFWAAPGAFAHPTHGDVDAFVMFRGL